jgi:hypothetical protein
MPVELQQTTRYYIAEDENLHNLHCEDLKCYVELIFKNEHKYI